MSRYLVALSIGPIQDFIAAARRTRDLWFGSYLLSEVSKAAARSLQEQGASLIFPAPADPEALSPDSTLNVANKILAELDTEDPRQSLERARQATQLRWEELARDCLEELPRKLQKYQVSFHVRQTLWNDQVADVLEFFCAWVPLATGPEALNTARRQVDRLLAARKNTRDFLPTRHPHLAYAVPKSSLDGKRESVLPDADHLPNWFKRKLGLTTG